MAAVQLVGAIAAEQHQATRGVAHEERDQVARRLIGPVQVLDREDQRRLLPQPLEQGEHGLEEACAGQLLVQGRVRVVRGRARAELGEERRQMASALPQQLGQIVALAQHRTQRAQ